MNNPDADTLARKFAEMCKISMPEYEVLDKGGEPHLAIHVGRLNHLYTDALAQLRTALPDNRFSQYVYLKPVTPPSWLRSDECQLLQGLLAESLTIGKESLRSDFHAKSIPFLGGEERRISNQANHVVFGRRGAGKSSLLLHACMTAEREGKPFVWLAMQNYQGRRDFLVIPQVLYEVFDAMSALGHSEASLVQLRKIASNLEAKGQSLAYAEINTVLPTLKRHILPFVQQHQRFYIFVDDLHLLHPDLQPYLLSTLYSFSRGNSIFIKATAIENLTRLYNPNDQIGLQPPGDAQVIRLDYNLVNPGAAYDHIRNILNSYVQYVGIPSISSLAGMSTLQRLTWVCAGVPRDALYILNNAITKAIAARRKSVTVTDINMAAADSMIEKERYVSADVAGNSGPIQHVIEDIKEFCKESKRNAFLVHIEFNNPRYQLMHKVSDLRFIHVLHPGITPEKAGEKYEVFLLDYAFYTGFRKTPSIKEVVAKPTTPTVKQLRKLPRYDYNQRLPNV